MKLNKIIIGLAFCVTYNCTYADYVRTTSNGGPNGYLIVHKIVEGNSTSIDCYDSGHETCPTISKNSSEQPAIDFAIAQIVLGILNGTETINGVVVTWRSLDREMTNSRITVQ